MPQYVVDMVGVPSQWTSPDNTVMNIFPVTFQGETLPASVFRPQASAPPQRGETMDGDLLPDNRGGRKFKKTQRAPQGSPNGAGGQAGGDGRSEASSRINSCHIRAVELVIPLFEKGYVEGANVVPWVMQTAEALASHWEDYAKPKPHANVVMPGQQSPNAGLPVPHPQALPAPPSPQPDYADVPFS